MKAYCKNCQLIQPASFRLEKDAITGSHYEDLCCDSCHFIAATIQEREAPAQPAPVQEPVAYLVTGPYEKRLFPDLNSANAYCSGLNRGWGKEVYTVSSLYTTPPTAQRQWVGLTDEEIATAWPYELGLLEKQFAFNLEVKLKEKNNG